MIKEGGEMDPRYIQQMVKRYAVTAGIEKDISRHTFATDLYRETKQYLTCSEGARTSERSYDVDLHPHRWRRA